MSNPNPIQQQCTFSCIRTWDEKPNPVHEWLNKPTTKLCPLVKDKKDCPVDCSYENGKCYDKDLKDSKDCHVHYSYDNGKCHSDPHGIFDTRGVCLRANSKFSPSGKLLSYPESDVCGSAEQITFKDAYCASASNTFKEAYCASICGDVVMNLQCVPTIEDKAPKTCDPWGLKAFKACAISSVACDKVWMEPPDSNPPWDPPS